MIDRALAIAGLALAVVSPLLPSLVPSIPKRLVEWGCGLGALLLFVALVVFCLPDKTNPEISSAQNGEQTAQTINNNGPVYNAPVIAAPSVPPALDCPPGAGICIIGSRHIIIRGNTCVGTPNCIVGKDNSDIDLSGNRSINR